MLNQNLAREMTTYKYVCRFLFGIINAERGVTGMMDIKDFIKAKVEEGNKKYMDDARYQLLENELQRQFGYQSDKYYNTCYHLVSFFPYMVRSKEEIKPYDFVDKMFLKEDGSLRKKYGDDDMDFEILSDKGIRFDTMLLPNSSVAKILYHFGGFMDNFSDAFSGYLGDIKSEDKVKPTIVLAHEAYDKMIRRNYKDKCGFYHNSVCPILDAGADCIDVLNEWIDNMNELPIDRKDKDKTSIEIFENFFESYFMVINPFLIEQMHKIK